MASFQRYETKQGYKWKFQTRVGPEKKLTTRRGFNTKKEAQIAAAELENEVRNGTYIKEQDTLFKDFCKDWLSMYGKSAKVSSVRAREKQLDRLIDYFGQTKIKNITKLMYQNALNDLHEKGYAHNTLDGIHTSGRMVFKKAIELNMIKQNPAASITLPKKIETVEELESKEKEIKYLEKGELGTFLNAAKENGLDNDYALFTLLAYSGIRTGELLALKWADVDFEENTISITKTLYNPSNNKEKYQLLTPKTRGSIRSIKIDPNVMKLLKIHKAQQNELKMYTRDKYLDKDFVITKPSGHPEYIKKIQNRMQRLLKLANIEKNVTPHSLRHTHTSLLIEAGVGIKEIQQRLGHTDIETTMNIYAHMTKNMEEKASQKFSELMKGLIF
jgi:integrase